jgi:translation initiation factor 3 subunit G
VRPPLLFSSISQLNIHRIVVDAPLGLDSDMPTPSESAAGAAAGLGGVGGSKYVPPSMRGGASAAMREGSGARTGADLPTLRVTNVSEETQVCVYERIRAGADDACLQEQDLRDLFSNFGRVARVYVGRDRETGAGKGLLDLSPLSCAPL